MEMMNTTGEIDSLPPTIYDGSLVLDSFIHRNIVPLPLQDAGNSTLTLMLADGSIHISAKNISLEAEGGFSFVEHVDF